MDRTKLLLAGIIIILIVGIAVIFVTSQKQENVTNQQNDLFTKTSPQLAQDDNSQPTHEGSSRYVIFSPTVLAETSDTRRVLYFYASWCPTCRPADASFGKNQAQIPEDVVVIRVNYNDTDTDSSEKELAKQYGITYQHTFVQIDAQGNEITKWNGGDIDKLLTTIQ